MKFVDENLDDFLNEMQGGKGDHLRIEDVDQYQVEVGREVEMKASYGTLAVEWHIAMKLLEKKKIQVKPIISHLAPLEDIQDVFQKLLNPETPWVQAVVTFK